MKYTKKINSQEHHKILSTILSSVALDAVAVTAVEALAAVSKQQHPRGRLLPKLNRFRPRRTRYVTSERTAFTVYGPSKGL